MRPSGHSLRASLLLLLLSVCCPTATPAAAKPAKDDARAMTGDGSADDPDVKPKKRDDNGGARPSKRNPADVQARALERLREKLDVPDDTEWALIAERIAKVDEVRRTLWTGAATARGPTPGADKGKRAGGSSGNPERDALRSAVTDKLPDAEIKSRLARAHEINLQNEARLAQAQADLRAVLSIRQEAVAVMAGLLAP